jgi:glycosyltransferase involved in cell wall biosynthesis
VHKFAFAIDNNVGNATYGRNLARFIEGRADTEATFFRVELIADDVWQLLPGIRGNYALTASARAAAALYARRRRSGLDAAFVHSQSIGLFCLDFMKRVPTLISSDATPLSFDQLAHGYSHKVYGPRTERMKHLWTKATIRAARVLLGWSKWVTDSYVNDYGADPARTIVIPPGVDIELWKPASEARADDGIVRILFTGGEFKRKGGDLLLRWARETRHKNIEVHIVTRDPVAATPRVIVHNDVSANAPKLVALAQKCDLFALPTRADCFSVAGIEASSAGLPLVMTDVGGIREIIEDGVNGLLAPLGDDVGFFERLDKVVADGALRRRMGQAARRIVEQRFDARKNAEAVLEAMRGIAN